MRKNDRQAILVSLDALSSAKGTDRLLEAAERLRSSPSLPLLISCRHVNDRITNRRLKENGDKPVAEGERGQTHAEDDWMTEQEKRLHRCCFAGHRPEGILMSETTAKEWLRYQIQQAIADSFTTFITGMGMGVDIWAAEIVIELRAANPSLHLIAVEP